MCSGVTARYFILYTFLIKSAGNCASTPGLQTHPCLLLIKAVHISPLTGKQAPPGSFPLLEPGGPCGTDPGSAEGRGWSRGSVLRGGC